MKSTTVCPAQKTAFEYVRNSLDSGVWPPGQRMPPIRQLSKLAGIGVRTMVKAIAELKAQGFVTCIERGCIRAGRGANRLPDGTKTRLLTWQIKRAEIEKDILSGAYAQEGRLPTCKELQHRYGTCFSTMRRILSALVADGVLQLRDKSHVIPNFTTRSTDNQIVFITTRLKTAPRSALNPLGYRVTDSLERECLRRGIQLQIVEATFSDPANIRRVLAMPLFSKPAMGYVLDMWWSIEDDVQQSYTSILESLFALKKPVAILDELGNYLLPLHYSANPLFQVFRIEGRRAGARMARLILNLGHRSVSYISAAPSARWSIERAEGVEEEFEKAGIAGGVHIHSAFDTISLTMFLFSLSGFSEQVTRRVLSVGRTKKQAHDEYDALQAFRQSNPELPFTPDEIRALQRELAGIADMARGDTTDASLGAASEAVFNNVNTAIIALLLKPVFTKALEPGGSRAWLCSNDHTAIKALHFLRERKVAVPDAISVAGFDNLSAESLENRLTTYDFNTAGFMYRMLDFIARPPKPRGLYRHVPIEVEGTIIVRATTGKARTSR
jgi:DNA-binding LacI/PurR family transcriptional regulator